MEIQAILTELLNQINDLQNKINSIMKFIELQNEKIDVIVQVFKEFEEETNKFKNIDLLVSDEQIMNEFKKDISDFNN